MFSARLQDFNIAKRFVMLAATQTTCLLLSLWMVLAFSKLCVGNPEAPSREIVRGTDSLFNLNSRENFATSFSRRPKTYYGATFRNIDSPFSDGCRLFEDVETLAKKLSLMSKLHRIKLDREYTPHGTFYLEARIGLHTSWCIINIDSVKLDSNRAFRLYISQNYDPVLNSSFDKKQSGWFRTKNNNYHVVWCFRKVDARVTRYGMIAWMSPDIYVPNWLYNLVARFAMPGILEDLEKALTKA